jgi:hypothetical protein
VIQGLRYVFLVASLASFANVIFVLASRGKFGVMFDVFPVSGIFFRPRPWPGMAERRKESLEDLLAPFPGRFKIWAVFADT